MPTCETCLVPESTYHYLIVCKHYDILRVNIASYMPIEYFNVNTLLHGSSRYSKDLNVTIQKVTLTVYHCLRKILRTETGIEQL